LVTDVVTIEVDGLRTILLTFYSFVTSCSGSLLGIARKILFMTRFVQALCSDLLGIARKDVFGDLLVPALSVVTKNGCCLPLLVS
jgi:hypothetical protein